MLAVKVIDAVLQSITVNVYASLLLDIKKGNSTVALWFDAETRFLVDGAMAMITHVFGPASGPWLMMTKEIDAIWDGRTKNSLTGHFDNVVCPSRILLYHFLLTKIYAVHRAAVLYSNQLTRSLWPAKGCPQPQLRGGTRIPHLSPASVSSAPLSLSLRLGPSFSLPTS